MKFKHLAASAVLAAVTTVAAQASAAVISNGTLSVGVNAYGQLYDGDAGVGLRRESDGRDVISPGTPRDSWGLGANYADDQFYGVSGVSIVDFESDANSALVTTLTDDGFLVEQYFSFVSSDVLAVRTKLTNTNAFSLGATFQRVVDFDVSSDFDDTVTGLYGPGAPGRRGSTISGFEDPSTTSPFNFNCVNCNETGDLGAGLRIRLRPLAAGDTSVFTYYYGLGGEGQSLAGVVNDTRNAGAQRLLALTASDGGGTATLGVTVPEPGTWALMLMGFFGLGSALRRRRPATA
jgi:hypothetical protein